MVWFVFVVVIFVVVIFGFGCLFLSCIS